MDLFQDLFKEVKRKLKVNFNGDHDIDLKQANVTIDVKSSWCESEKDGLIDLDLFLNSTLEVKNHKSAVDFNSLFIEYKTLFEKENELKPSGIDTSKADRWYIVMGEVSLIITLPFLKWLYNNRNTLKLEEKISRDQSHQATGFIVPIGLIFPLMNIYYQEKNNKRAAEVYKNFLKNG